MRCWTRVRHAHSRWVPCDDVDVIDGIAGGDDLSVERHRLELEKSREPCINGWVKQRKPLAGGPNEVDEQRGA